MHITGDNISGIPHPINSTDLATDWYIKKTLHKIPDVVGPAGSVLVHESPFMTWRMVTSVGQSPATYASVSPNYLGITNGNGLFVLTSEWAPYVQVSTDGIRWTARTIGDPRGLNTSEMGSFIQYFPQTGLYLLTKNGYFDVQTSTDTIVWTPRTSHVSAGARKIVYGNGKYIAIASFAFASYQSTDAIIWSFRSNVPVSGGANSLMFGQGKFVFHNSSGAYFSTDGLAWGTRTAGNSLNASSVSPGEYLPWLDIFYVADATYNTGNSSPPPFYVSTDSITWEVRGMPVPWRQNNLNEALASSSTLGTYRGHNVFYSLYGGGPTLGVVAAPNTLYTTTDLINWVRRTHQNISDMATDPVSVNVTSDIANHFWRGFAAGDPKYNQNMMLIYGSNNMRPPYSGSLHYTTLGGFKWAAANYKASLNSHNDENTANSLSGYAEWNKPGYYGFNISKSAKKIMVELTGGGGAGAPGVGGLGGNGGQGGQSGNYNVTVIDAQELNQGTGLAVYVGQGGSTSGGTGLMRTTDGIAYTQHFHPFYSDFSQVGLYHMAYDSSVGAVEKYAILADRTSAGGGGLASSTDAISWTIRTVGEPFTTKFYQIEKFPAGWVLVGQNGSCKVSTDAINWQSRTTRSAYSWYTCFYAAPLSLYLIAGSSGGGMISTDTINWTDRSPLGLAFNNRDVFKNTMDYSPSPSMFVAGTNNSQTTRSTDGIVWREFNTARSYNGDYLALKYWNGAWYWYNTNTQYRPTKVVIKSTDTTNWEDISKTFLNGFKNLSPAYIYPPDGLASDIYQMYIHPNPAVNRLEVLAPFSTRNGQYFRTTTDAINFTDLKTPAADGNCVIFPPVWDGTATWYPYQNGNNNTFGENSVIRYYDKDLNIKTIEANGGASGINQSTFGFIANSRAAVYSTYEANPSLGGAGGGGFSPSPGVNAEIRGSLWGTGGGGGAFAQGAGGSVLTSSYGSTITVGGGTTISPDGSPGMDPGYVMNKIGSGGGGGGVYGDGTTPTRLTNVNITYNAPTYNMAYDATNNIWVWGSGSGPMISVSTDFITWIYRSSFYDNSVGYSGNIKGIVYAPASLVWVSYYNERAIQVSTDTIVWIQRTAGIPSGSGRTLKYGACSTGNFFVAQTYYGHHFSTDTINWRYVNSMNGSFIQDWWNITFDGQAAYAARYGYVVHRSTDTVNWDFGQQVIGFNSYAYALEGRVVDNYTTKASVMIGYQGGNVRAYINGSWVARTTGLSYDFFNNVFAPPSNDGKFYLSGYRNYAESTDSIHWSQGFNIVAGQDFPTAAVFNVANKQYRAVSNGATFVSSNVQSLTTYPGVGGEGTCGGGGGGGAAAGSSIYRVKSKGGKGGDGRVAITWW